MTEQITYTTKDGDRLDDLVFRRYAVEKGAVEWVIKNNPMLRDMPMVLGAGIDISMPPLPSTVNVVRTVNPWGRR